MIIIIHIECKLDCQKQIKEKNARQRKSCRTASGYSVSVCSGFSLQSSSSVTPRASAIFIALDTRQSPLFSISCNVRLEMPISSTSCGILKCSFVRISRTLIQSPQKIIFKAPIVPRIKVAIKTRKIAHCKESLKRFFKRSNMVLTPLKNCGILMVAPEGAVDFSTAAVFKAHQKCS